MLYWLIALASLIGVWLNIRRNSTCFWIWIVTNSTWAIIDLQHDLPQQAVLQGVYVGLSVYGIWKWSRLGRRGEDKW